MAYLVNVTARAGRDLTHLYREIDTEHSDAALKWYRGLKDAILSLEARPNRCPVTPESDKLSHLLYGNKPHIQWAMFQVLEKEKRVEVLDIRHGARRRFEGPDVAQRFCPMTNTRPNGWVKTTPGEVCAMNCPAATILRAVVGRLGDGAYR